MSISKECQTKICSLVIRKGWSDKESEVRRLSAQPSVRSSLSTVKRLGSFGYYEKEKMQEGNLETVPVHGKCKPELKHSLSSKLPGCKVPYPHDAWADFCPIFNFVSLGLWAS
jgi:hypothetical protein